MLHSLTHSHIMMLLNTLQVSFERSSEKMGVTNCKHIKNVR